MTDTVPVTVFCLLGGYLSHRFTCQFTRSFYSRNGSGDNAMEIIMMRIITPLFYGFIPFIIFYAGGIENESYGIKGTDIVYMLTAAGLGSVLLTVNILIASSESNLRDFPQIRRKEWDIKLLALSAITWTIYLFGYEMMFRGYLLFGLNEHFGKEIAVGASTLIYVAVHLHKGWKESVGSLVLGVILSVLCLKAGSFLPAFVTHIFLALSNEWTSLRAHPDMKLKL